ncbi:MAG: hypothetical protein FJ135_02855 [Deltaproteobacteria bacterium]|nr:hypothetical protein [Deltaproteobacteria bacterium]
MVIRLGGFVKAGQIFCIHHQGQGRPNFHNTLGLNQLYVTYNNSWDKALVRQGQNIALLTGGDPTVYSRTFWLRVVKKMFHQPRIYGEPDVSGAMNSLVVFFVD